MRELYVKTCVFSQF